MIVYLENDQRNTTVIDLTYAGKQEIIDLIESRYDYKCIGAWWRTRKHFRKLAAKLSLNQSKGFIKYKNKLL